MSDGKECALLMQSVVDVLPSEKALQERLAEGKPLRVKLGA